MLSPEMMAHWEFVAQRDVPGQGTCVVRPFLFTHGLCTQVVVNEHVDFYQARYCYPSRSDALEALATWDGVGDPPGDWVKEKRSERLGPGANVSDEERKAHDERVAAQRDADLHAFFSRNGLLP